MDRLSLGNSQPILMRLQSDFPTLCEDILTRKKPSMNIKWDKRSALTVVMAADGYPQNPRKGDLINSIPKDSPDIKDLKYDLTSLTSETL
mgnify:CR=1 FL=1